MTTTKFIGAIPVIPSGDIERDLKWYNEQAGFDTAFVADGYAGLSRENIHLHLQWHAGTEEDPLLGGSVVKVFVENIQPLFNELVERRTVSADALRKTAWQTTEFGFYDLNKNAIFFVEVNVG
ncbi:MAG: glyoxalase/bleomycin resistance/extradiol dioxygenase family protein [Bacteroidota bacterium]